MASNGIAGTNGASAPASGLVERANNVPKVVPSSTTNPTKICVFMGSAEGTSPAHMKAAAELSRVFAKHNISLVYGGGTVGLMGEAARTLVSHSGPDSVHGIIPAPLVQHERGPNTKAKDIKPNGSVPDPEKYGRTTVIDDMHTRKRLMANEVMAAGPGSGFIALSGGYGTLEELMEITTWNQLGIHNKGIVIFNVEGYWDGLLQWIKGSVDAGFVKGNNKDIIKVATTAEECVELLASYEAAEGRFKLQWGNE